MPSALSYRRWQASEDLDSKPLRATAQVAQVTRITQVDPFPCRPGGGSRCGRRNTLYDVAQPYDIVELRFVPDGAAGEVIAIDAVDAGSSDATPGSSVEIAYAAGQARAPQILGTTHTHHWRNTLGFVVPISLVVVLFLAVDLVGRDTREPRPPPTQRTNSVERRCRKPDPRTPEGTQTRSCLFQS